MSKPESRVIEDYFPNEDVSSTTIEDNVVLVTPKGELRAQSKSKPETLIEEVSSEDEEIEDEAKPNIENLGSSVLSASLTSSLSQVSESMADSTLGSSFEELQKTNFGVETIMFNSVTEEVNSSLFHSPSSSLTTESVVHNVALVDESQVLPNETLVSQSFEPAPPSEPLEPLSLPEASPYPAIAAEVLQDSCVTSSPPESSTETPPETVPNTTKQEEPTVTLQSIVSPQDIGLLDLVLPTSPSFSILVNTALVAGTAVILMAVQNYL